MADRQPIDPSANSCSADSHPADSRSADSRSADSHPADSRSADSRSADSQAGPDPADPSDSAELARAQAALERGDYGGALRVLAPLAEAHAASTALGGRIRLLMATALMGQGESAAAAACCRSLRGCRDLTLRQQARDLEEVLEAPSLQRPRNWSVQLPSLGDLERVEGRSPLQSWRRRPRPEPPPPPPVGPPRTPWGFALVAVALLLLTVFLAGCVAVETSLQFPAPGRLQITQTSTSASGQPLPWQRDLAAALGGGSVLVEQDHGRQSLRRASQPAAPALAWLGQSLERAAALAGVDLPPPRLTLRERNWLIGVQQQLELVLDLRGLNALPGLELGFRFAPLDQQAVQQAAPNPVQAGPEARTVRWRLEPGALNRLQARTWRWSRLGLGAVAVALLLALALLLQRLRLQAGFGFPQLPA